MKTTTAVLLTGIAVMGMASCQTVQTTGSVPAVLVSADDVTLNRLRSYLGASMGRTSVTLGAGDLEIEPVLSVLPPPLSTNETHSLAIPFVYDLQLTDGLFQAVRRDTQNIVSLPTIPCKPA